MTTALSLLALPALAQDAAFLLGNDRYQNFDRLRGAANLADEARAFQRAAYDVQAVQDAIEAI